MRLPSGYTLKQIADIIGCTFEGPSDFPVLGINEIHKVKAGDLVFVDHPKYYDKALNSAATIVLINQKVVSQGKVLAPIEKIGPAGFPLQSLGRFSKTRS
jgi:UDP-3-O-[3-hydroxymyristoyl] glucosamine N-acyltransferase